MWYKIHPQLKKGLIKKLLKILFIYHALLKNIDIFLFKLKLKYLNKIRAHRNDDTILKINGIFFNILPIGIYKKLFTLILPLYPNIIENIVKNISGITKL